MRKVFHPSSLKLIHCTLRSNCNWSHIVLKTIPHILTQFYSTSPLLDTDSHLAAALSTTMQFTL